MHWTTIETEEGFAAAREQYGDFEAIRGLINRTLTARTIPTYPAYFFEGHWLVTYDWALALAESAERRAIETATWQIKQSFPRWLRWLIR